MKLQGDSGGPLVIKDENGKSTQVGLTSYGVSVGCELGYPSAFTRISSYADWLEANMQLKIKLLKKKKIN